MNDYVHGYSDRETRRLSEQSDILESLMHEGLAFEAGSHVLEAGCGVGAQTQILCRNHPGIQLTSIDISEQSLAKARQFARDANLTNVTFMRGDINDLQFPDDKFDHVFVCFVLEHLSSPERALQELKRVLKKGGTITANEGDHESCLWSPVTDAAKKMWDAMKKVQQEIGHDPLIGRRLYPLLTGAGFNHVEVVPRPAYVDDANPQIKHDAINKILVPMCATAREKALQMGIIDAKTWDRGLKEYAHVGDAKDGTLFYTWFRGVGVK